MIIIMKFKMISVDEIQPNPFQPREKFEKESLKELADSVKDVSIIQPIIVRQQGFTYQIIAGERRWRAAKMAALKKIPCMIKEITEERVLLESLIENLHRKDLTDIERENAIHEIWLNRAEVGFKHKYEIAQAMGIHPSRVEDDLEAWEARHEKGMSLSVSTRTIARTRGLDTEVRKGIVKKVAEGDLKASEVDVVAKVVRKASEPIKKELLRQESKITPRMAEIIVSKLPKKDDQEAIVKAVKRNMLTEDEVEEHVREIQKTRQVEPPSVEVRDKEDTIHVVSEYDCPHCRRHYVIKCDGEHDWLE